MRTGEVSRLLSAPISTIIFLIKTRKIKVNKSNKQYFYTPENIEQIKKELIYFKQKKDEKKWFLELFWDEIKDDNKRGDVVKNYSIRFEVGKTAAGVVVNNYLVERSKQNYQKTKERVETREDGTVVLVLQSKINFEKL
jgi:hypothetical protein